MRFVVERDALAEAVAWIARSLPSRPVLPVLSGLLLQAAPGSLTLSCFDYEVSARISIDADVAETARRGPSETADLDGGGRSLSRSPCGRSACRTPDRRGGGRRRHRRGDGGAEHDDVLHP